MSETQESDGEREAPLAIQTSDPPADSAKRSCPHCDDGVVWENETNGHYICDSCHTVFGAGPNSDPAARQASLREQRQSYDERGEYDGSGRARLFGGYRRAYLSWNTGSEYAIDSYGEEVDGLLVPHKRDWAYDL